jgi:DNA-binding response OmpR family regulator
MMPPIVLVVDDDREIASIITDLLLDEGYEATAAFDGQQALDHIDRHHVDLLVSDIRMPRVDGIELITSLRRRGWGRPAVLMSAVDPVRPNVDGVVFLRKPVDLDEFVTLIQRLLAGNAT